ncbi:MAG: cytidylate kinase-like family protein [Treponema sp.]|jgi:cytidylate kinase|nr:cytidylate kinase-like family protein [Treponema sp.]HAK69571.1 cytidylate kinase-like family protein [Treponema sp.]HBB43339.1 cytidylate kinase-like family protein [Treponema sp.]
MAVITISRQVASLGDEIAGATAKKMGYTFIDRKQIEARIVELGFPKEKLSKYDERKPGFFASLNKDRDEYLNYLQYAVLEAASVGNCILIGRGTFKILEEVPNMISLRLVANDVVRRERLKKEFNWNDKQAQGRIDESDANRRGFHKSFFNIENDDSREYMFTLNTGLLTLEDSVRIIEGVTKNFITAEKESLGRTKVEQLLKGQRLVNQLLFDFKLGINFLRAEVGASVITLHGVADSQGIAERAVQTAAKILPSVEIRSAISVVQDFKPYQ